MKRKVK